MPEMSDLLALRSRVPDATLLDYEQRYGMVTIRRLGPAGLPNVTDCDIRVMVVSC